MYFWTEILWRMDTHAPQKRLPQLLVPEFMHISMAHLAPYATEKVAYDAIQPLVVGSTYFLWRMGMGVPQKDLIQWRMG